MTFYRANIDTLTLPVRSSASNLDKPMYLDRLSIDKYLFDPHGEGHWVINVFHDWEIMGNQIINECQFEGHIISKLHRNNHIYPFPQLTF